MKRTNPILLITALVSFAVSNCEQKEVVRAPQFESILMSTIDYSIYDLTPDMKNNVWLATSTGLGKYNSGTTIFYTNGGLASDTIWKVAADSLGNVWGINNNGKISQFDGKKFTIHQPSIRPVTILSHPTALMVDYKNHLWVAAYCGLYRYDGVSWAFYFTSMAASNAWAKKLYPDPENENNILIFTNNPGVVRFNGSTYEKLDSLYGEAASNLICIAKNSKGVIYGGVYSKGLLVYNRGQSSFISLGPNEQNSLGPGFFEKVITDICIGKNDQVWVANYNRIVSIDHENISYYQINSIEMQNDIHLDNNNNPWLMEYGTVYTLK